MQNGACGASSDVECVYAGGATFGGTVAFECAIPFRASGADGRHKSGRHLCGFLGRGIEFGYQLTRVEEEACNGKPAGVNHDEVPRRRSMRRPGMRAR